MLSYNIKQKIKNNKNVFLTKPSGMAYDIVTLLKRKAPWQGDCDSSAP
jgi:hypothetical protein